MVQETEASVRGLQDLVPVLQRAGGFAEVVAALQRGEAAAVDGAWGSSCALTAAALAAERDSPLLVVLPRLADVDDFAEDLAAFSGENPPIFPAWETLPDEQHVADSVFGHRLQVLNILDGWPGSTEGGPRDQQAGGSLRSTPATPRLIVTSIAALLQPVPGRAERRQSARTLRVGDEIDLDELLQGLVERGFERVTTIERPGEFSVRGGIFDVYPPDAEDPLRIELFGDEIESIRRFDVETQRTLDEVREATLTLLASVTAVRKDNASSPEEKEERGARSEERQPSDVAPHSSPFPAQPGRSFDRESGESLLDALPSGSRVALVELQELIDEGRHYLNRLDDPRGLFSVDAALSRATEFPSVTLAAFAADSTETSCHLPVESVERFTGAKSQVLEEMASVVGRDERVLIACHNEAEQHRLSELLAEADGDLGERVTLCLGNVHQGFRLVPERTVVLSDHELFGRTDLRRVARRRKKIESRAIDSFLDLEEGDLVVHLSHGIGRYRGMQLLEKADQVEEHLVVEFRDGVKIYVPASLIHLVQKYVGASKAAPELSKVGGKTWARKKQRAAEAVNDLAADMLRLQAERESKPGIAYPPDTNWLREFEAAFPYTETDDQLDTIAAVKGDMEKQGPMDRLICGDVGYGKTEIAIRAAFKAVEAGKQVAVLVPTTVLAEQHYRTFSQRLAEYPLHVEVLSRFKTKGQQREVLKRMEEGSVDIVIGTHRLVQQDVRFKELGLVVIDEEQRFGVQAKETLKQLRLEVDVLTLSATPIPRTLHMALLGIRDISNLQTPPHDRLAVETRISRFDPELIRGAIIRELNRGGQVYFVHNRVHNIRAIADRVQAIVPEATVDIAHGQMPEGGLAAAMLEFVSGRTDVLVCTTIIESGLDIPNANTMFIHRADQYGLADLHQLRGRVGRYKHRAYCYLLLEEGRTLTATAAKRMKAIEEFSELGAGFKIAMRDLEIRGAGNILGTEQSGHISAVGYELYCQLLENAVRRMKNEPVREEPHVAIDLPVTAYFPNAYIPPGRQKIELYRKLSGVQSLDELAELENELRDRFGPLPEEATRLLGLKRLVVFAGAWRIDEIYHEDRFAVFGYRNARAIEPLKATCGSRLRIVDNRRAYLVLSDAGATEEALLEELESVLQPAPDSSYTPPPFRDKVTG